MAKFSGEPQVGHVFDHTQRDTSQQIAIHTRLRDVNGREWVYLEGTASVTAGTFVTFDENGDTTRLAANAVGPVAVAGTAIAQTEFGWFQIYGYHSGAKLAGPAASADKAIYIHSVGGVSGDDVSGDLVEGAIAVAAASGSAQAVWLSYPVVYDVAQD